MTITTECTWTTRLECGECHVVAVFTTETEGDARAALAPILGKARAAGWTVEPGDRCPNCTRRPQ